MNYITLAAKIGAAALLLWIGWHFGGLSKDDELNKYKTAVEAQHAAQLQIVANVMTQHDQQAAAERAAQQKVIDAYDAEKNLAPITTGIVQRMRIVEAAAACSAGNSVVPKAGPMASGAQGTGGVPGGLSEGERLLQGALDAASRDASRLNAAVKLAP